MTRIIMTMRLAALMAMAACSVDDRSSDPIQVEAVPPLIVPDRARDPQLDLIELPPGFSIHTYAEGLVGARSLAMGSNGTLFVGTQWQGSVYAAIDADGDYFAETVLPVATDLNTPNGVAFREGALYVAEVNKILRYDAIEARLAAPSPPIVISESFPSDRGHGWKFIRFGPDGLLYVPVGAPCNICERDDPYAAILRMSPDGTGLEIFARGVRNTVGFDWHPQSRDLWFTDNGRDNLGDNLPPDELNHAPDKGLHFGFPYCHGGDLPDPKFGIDRTCDEFRGPAQKLGPHVAAIGMRFYDGTMFPKHYHGRIIIAEHGSWNRSQKIGYRLSMVTLEGDKAVNYAPFATGWLQGDSNWGRPVDVLVMKDGSLLVSDDQGGRVYRIVYSE